MNRPPHGIRTSASAVVFGLCGVLVCSLAVMGCGSGGSGGGGGGVGNSPFVPLIDLHGDTALTATRLFVDAGDVAGAINTGGDVDFFSFVAVAGVTYVIQLFGYPAPFNDLNFEDPFVGRDLAVITIGPDGATQLQNSVGNFQGDDYDVDPAELGNPGEGFFVLGDSRVQFTAPSTGLYFLRLRHGRGFVGTGNYRVNLASSQTGLANGDVHFGMRHVFAIDPSSFEVLVDTDVFGAIELGWNSAQRLVSGGILISPLIFLPGSMDPETPGVHLHYGHPDTRFASPHRSFNETPSSDADDIHPTVFEFDIGDVTRRIARGEEVQSATVNGRYRSSTGEYVEFSAPMTIDEASFDDATKAFRMNFTIDLGESATRGGVGTTIGIPPDLFRTMVGWDWYVDLHWTERIEVELDFPPVTVSWPRGDLYKTYETALNMAPQNVVPPQSPAFPPFLLFYDTAQQLFQIDYSYTTPPPPQDVYRGLPIVVRAGRRGGVGSVILDLGVVPDPVQTPAKIFDPGARNVVKQLTSAEAAILRDAFYSTGFYVQVESPAFPSGIVRGDGFLGIQLNPRDNFPPESGARGEYDATARGSVTFVSDYPDGGAITIISNGKLLGDLSTFIEGAAPACGEAEEAGLSDTLRPEVYPYRAIAEDGTEWQGHFTIGGDGACETVVLSGA